jgi:hypothetical protein
MQVSAERGGPWQKPACPEALPALTRQVTVLARRARRS